ncbi:hypothetical protein [Streptomyces sp. YIM 98790]|uniref:hypothetical protein n=1 Tax=Streptomyces sp. YIM 98790 TaxID=2689077 RepID=UPI00140BB378|nr:hypothetical protein [Streptomyces sp. YIM 98790]
MLSRATVTTGLCASLPAAGGTATAPAAARAAAPAPAPAAGLPGSGTAFSRPSSAGAAAFACTDAPADILEPNGQLTPTVGPAHTGPDGPRARPDHTGAEGLAESSGPSGGDSPAAAIETFPVRVGG